MHEFMKIVGYILAMIGLVSIIKHIMHAKEGMHSKEGCVLCGWHKTTEEKKPAEETASHKINVEDEKPHGSRYGSNPANY